MAASVLSAEEELKSKVRSSLGLDHVSVSSMWCVCGVCPSSLAVPPSVPSTEEHKKVE